MSLGSGSEGLGLGINGVASENFCFTDQELTDILGYMESQDPIGVSVPFLAAPGTFQALQFQPHVPRSELDLAPNLELPSTSSPGGIKHEPIVSDYAGDFGGSLDAKQAIPCPSYAARGSRPSPKPPQNGLKEEYPTMKRQPSKKGQQGRSSSGEYSKGHISHSTVEKQRRDRINALIDELRELVPAQAADGLPLEASSESKRPKHVVLSDTIALVRDLQIKVRDTPPQSRTVSGDNEEVRSPETSHQDAKDLIKRVHSENPQSSDRDSERSGSGSPPELPLMLMTSMHYLKAQFHLMEAPENAPVSSGVVVEQGESCLYVKVNCKDRRGLLSDIIMALKSMPLEVTTAAVTTTQDGNVYDVFQIKLDPSSGISPQDVQCHVHASLYSTLAENAVLGDKRRRTAEV